MSTLWVVSYDIADDDRRREVAETLENHGVRVQYSVFECRLAAAEVPPLREGLKRLIDPAEDSIRWYPLCAWCEARVSCQGGGQPPAPDTGYVLV